MQNELKEIVDLYIPRKCSATGRLIHAKDHASVQINIAKLDENGVMMTGQNVTFALCGFVRTNLGEADDSINKLAAKAGLLKG